MPNKLLFLLLAIAPSFVTSQTNNQQVQKFAQQANIGFVENKGQLLTETGSPADRVLFYAFTETANVYITNFGINYQFTKKISKKGAPIKKYETANIAMQLEDANIQAANIKASMESSQGVKNYYMPHCPDGILGVKTFGKVTMQNVYPNIDWVLYATEKGLKHEFIVHPGADPSLITLKYFGAGEVKLSENLQNLSLHTTIGKLQEQKLVSYQADKSEVTTTYQKVADNTFKYRLEEYDPQQTLVIDPPMDLEWCTMHGGPEYDGGRAVATDDAGNVFVTGYLGTVRALTQLSSTDFPTLNPGTGTYFQNTQLGERSAHIIKFDNNGVRLWSTFYSSTGYFDQANDIGVDSKGNIFVVGLTDSADFPTYATGTAYLQPYGGSYVMGNFVQGDAFILKFDNNGIRQWATFYGGAATDEFAHALAIDKNDAIYVTGSVQGSGMPTFDMGGGAYYQPNPVVSVFHYRSAFVLKFDNDGTRRWATYFGGDDGDTGIDLAVDDNNNLIMVGKTGSENGFPLQDPGGGAYYQDTLNGGNDDEGFIAKFSPTGVLTWSTFYGGTDDDNFFGVETNSKNDIIVSGAARSFDFPLLDPGGGAYFQNTKLSSGSRWAGVLLKFTTGGIRTWSTYFSGSENDQPTYMKQGIVVDQGDNLIVGHHSVSELDAPTFDPGGGAYFQAYGGTGVNNWNVGDGLISSFNDAGVQTWSTFFGGDSADWITGMCIDNNGCLFATGEFRSGDAPVKDAGNGAYFQPYKAGDDELYVAKFCPLTSLVANVEADSVLCKGDSTGTARVSIVKGSPNYSFDWQPTGGTDSVASGLPAGTYTVVITDATTSISKTVTIYEPDSLTLDPLQDQSICTGDNITLNASANGGTPGYTYDWNSGAASTSSYNVSPVDTTDYYVDVTDKNGCTVTDTLTVNVVQSIQGIVSPDTAICLGADVQLSANGGSSYSWTPTASLDDPNSATPTATPSSPTTYTVIVTSGSCDPDTQEVFVDISASVTAFVSGNVTICNGDSVQIIASGGSTYNWEPNTDISDVNIAAPYVYPNTTTTYSVVVGDGNCDPDTAEVIVTVVPSIASSVGPDAEICEGDSVQLTASGGNTYAWSPSTSLNSATGASVWAQPTSTTDYTVVVTSGACAPDSNSITVTVNPIPTANAGDTVTIKTGESVSLQGTGGGIYLWTPAASLSDTISPNPVASPTVTTTYTLFVVDNNGCVDTATVTVFVKDECLFDNADELFFLPTAFSPNGDGINDKFFVRVNQAGCVIGTKLVVFDRWGEKVFETLDPSVGWDGTYRDRLMNEAVFDYYIEATLYDNSAFIKQGNVTLIR